METDIKSILHLELLQFENIEFTRTGRRNNKDVSFEFRIDISRKDDEDIFKVTMTCEGKKENEYNIRIVLSGYFSFEITENLDKETKERLLSQNAVAIIMPYVRSEISILTAQPDVDSVVLPPFNITGMMR